MAAHRACSCGKSALFDVWQDDNGFSHVECAACGLPLDNVEPAPAFYVIGETANTPDGVVALAPRLATEDDGVIVCINHSKWGKHLVRMTKRVYQQATPSENLISCNCYTYANTGVHADSCNFFRHGYNWCFYYPSGAFFAELDEDAGGGIGHPNEEVDKFTRSRPYGSEYSLYEEFAPEYIELENFLINYVYAIDPTYFFSDVVDRANAR